MCLLVLRLRLGWLSLAPNPLPALGLEALAVGVPLAPSGVLCLVSRGVTDTSLSVLSVSLQPLLGKACL